MRAWEVRGAFGLDNLTLAERPEPVPGPGEVLLAMRAVSLNYRDLLMVGGRYDPRQKLPLVPASDGVGEVVAVGEGVSRVRLGDRVATLFCQRWLAGPPTRERLRSTLGGPLDGVLAERRVLAEDGVVQLPEHLTDAEAATLPCAALTAWSALVTQGEVGAGDTVLVQGTGGVSTFALQLSQLLGARVIATTGSADKLERLRQLGAWQVIDYRQDPAWGKTAREMTDGVGVDQVVEVGGAGTLQQSLAAVRIGGQISVIGVLAGASSELEVVPILMKNVRLQGVLVGSRDSFEAMSRAIAHHRLRPLVDRVFPFAAAPDAFAYLRSGAHHGKVCIELQG